MTELRVSQQLAAALHPLKHIHTLELRYVQVPLGIVECFHIEHSDSDDNDNAIDPPPPLCEECWEDVEARMMLLEIEEPFIMATKRQTLKWLMIGSSQSPIGMSYYRFSWGQRWGTHKGGNAE